MPENTLTSDVLRPILDEERLWHLASKHSSSYAAADPFPHAVMDDFLPDEVLDRVLSEFPQPGGINWQSYNAERERKLACEQPGSMGSFTQHVFSQLNSKVFMRFLEKLTGISGLIPDPHLRGGGLHQIEPGGYLKIHADFNIHERLKLDRRLNLLLFLNRDWKAEYGGCLELWAKDMSRCVKRVMPVFNRCIVFSTTDTSFHGHPEPLKCPDGMTRKALATYYYSDGRPASEMTRPHTTIFKTRPGENWQSEYPNPYYERRRSLKQAAKEMFQNFKRFLRF